MIDDDVLSRLTQLHDHIEAPVPDPGADAARGRRLLRRRRAVVAGVSAVAVVSVLGAVTLVTGGPQARDDVGPAQPGPTPTASVDDGWPLDRIRAEGTVEREDVTETGITVRLYAVCEGSESVCGPMIDPPIRREHSHFALEVAQGDESALFAVEGDWLYALTAYQDDAIILMDGTHPLGVAPSDPSYARHRVLRVDGTEQALRLTVDPAPAVPGPDVVVIDRAPYEGEGEAGMQFAFRLDESEGTLEPLDVPLNTDLGRVGNTWGPNTDEALWFVQAVDCQVYRVVNGSAEQYDACGPDFKGRWYDSLVHIDAGWFPEGWLTPDRMAVLEDSRDRLTLHASLDGGATWRHVPVADEADIPTALEALG